MKLLCLLLLVVLLVHSMLCAPAPEPNPNPEPAPVPQCASDYKKNRGMFGDFMKGFLFALLVIESGISIMVGWNLRSLFLKRW
jgi:hypothetical protein